MSENAVLTSHTMPIDPDTRSSTRIPSRRRNGQPAACEPCRKAKVKCDHGSPICSRCQRRRTPSACVFLNSATAQAHQSRLMLSEPRSGSLEPLRSPNPQTQTRHLGPENRPDPFSDGSGFLGLTSFAATIRQGRLTEETKDPLGEMTLGSAPLNNVETPAQISQGIKVLNQLPDQESCHTLLDWYLEHLTTANFHRLTISLSLESFWSTYGEILRGQRQPGDLSKIATRLCQNSSLPLKLSEDPQEWIASFSGPNTRWEIIGIFFVSFGYALLSLPERDLSFLFKVRAEDRNLLIAEMKRCVEACIDLSRGSLNSLVCNLLYHNLGLDTVLHGDASLSTWRLHLDLVGTSAALGLHCYQGTPNVTVHSELTKRLSACIFWSDKEIALFTGRPPCLSHRYYTCTLPLDISDQCLMAGGEELEGEIRSLNEDGWNTQGQIFDATLSRMMLTYALIQDEILELFLGNQAQWSQQNVDDIKSRARDMYARFPSQLQVSKSDLLNCKVERTIWQLICGRLDYLRIHFLLERLSTERGGANKRDLFEVAREMLDLTVFMWLERDRTANRKHDYDYMIICYGIPSIGILCTELLKQVQTPNEIDVKLPVSETVQNLSLMIGFLEWIQPSAGNYKLCQRMSRVVRRVLDKVFEPVSTDDVGREMVEAVGITENFWPVDGLNDLEWLNSVDWTLGPTELWSTNEKPGSFNNVL